MNSRHPKTASLGQGARPLRGKAASAEPEQPPLQLLSFGRGEACVLIRGSRDIAMARKTGLEFAIRLGFSTTEATLIAAITSELARMIVHSSPEGKIVFSVLENGNRRGLEVVAHHREAEPRPPGAAAASPWRLAGVGRLVDEFTIASEQGNGTTVTVKKWKQ